MPFRISKASISDVVSLALIEKDSFADLWNEKNLENEFKDNPFAEILLLKDDEKPIGYVDYMVTFDSATISRIAVIPEYRKRGCATLLMKAMEERLSALQEKPSFLTLEVRENNVGAIALYKKFGFVQVNVKKAYYSDGTDALYMVKGI